MEDIIGLKRVNKAKWNESYISFLEIENKFVILFDDIRLLVTDNYEMALNRYNIS